MANSLEATYLAASKAFAAHCNATTFTNLNEAKAAYFAAKTTEAPAEYIDIMTIFEA